MAERNENVLGWTIPNIVSIWLMVALLWAFLGIGTHLLFRRGKGPTVGAGVMTDNSGNIVTG